MQPETLKIKIIVVAPLRVTLSQYIQEQSAWLKHILSEDW